MSNNKQKLLTKANVKIGKSEKINKRLKAYNLKNILFDIFINDYENVERYLIK